DLLDLNSKQREQVLRGQLRTAALHVEIHLLAPQLLDRRDVGARDEVDLVVADLEQVDDLLRQVGDEALAAVVTENVGLRESNRSPCKAAPIADIWEGTVPLPRQDPEVISVVEPGGEVGRHRPVGQTGARREHHDRVRIYFLDQWTGAGLSARVRNMPRR